MNTCLSVSFDCCGRARSWATRVSMLRILGPGRFRCSADILTSGPGPQPHGDQDGIPSSWNIQCHRNRRTPFKTIFWPAIGLAEGHLKLSSGQPSESPEAIHWSHRRSFKTILWPAIGVAEGHLKLSFGQPSDRFGLAEG